MRSNIDLFTLANAMFAIECGLALDAEQTRVFEEYSEHVELATWNDGNVYSQDPVNTPEFVYLFRGI